jgi:hypothetical protein
MVDTTDVADILEFEPSMVRLRFRHARDAAPVPPRSARPAIAVVRRERPEGP